MGLKLDIQEKLNYLSKGYCIYTPDRVDEFLKEVGHNFKLLKNNKKIAYYNIPCSFDIETSSFETTNQLGENQKVALMYEWTLGINWCVIIGRTWEEFKKVYDKLVNHFQTYENRRLIIYVHNLSFEFQAFRKHFDWGKIFALEKRKPVQAITLQGIEFRCSYLLSGYGLARLDKQLQKYKVNKLVGDLDYSKIRHSKTPLTKQELQYCINDVLVVMAYIQELIERDGDITKLPLTKTGYVRNYCRSKCLYADKTHRKDTTKYKKYRELMKKLTITPEEYGMLKDAFMGGFTHANPYYSMGVFHNVKSYDFTSSYPTVMISEKFPMSKGEYVKIKDKEDFNQNILNYCCVFDVEFIGLRPIITYENYLSVSHCRRLKNSVENNGRIVSADSLETTITELDFFIINKFYAWEEIRVGKFIRYKKGYLPTDFVKAILDLYVTKTELKDVEGKEQEYLVSKENLNSCYGMTVTDICRDEIVYEDIWGSEQPDTEKAIEKYNSSVKRFLSYAWGVWVTAYARYNLFTGICEFKEDYIYSDTDSIKCQNYENHMDYINGYNNMIIKKLERALEHHKIDKSLIRPKNKYGKEKPLGVWTDEGVYTRFKTLGAKRYMTEDENGRISITVAGLNKNVATPYLIKTYGDKVFENFNDNLTVPADYTGKMTHTYIDEYVEGYVVDYLGNEEYFYEESGTHLENCEYSLSIIQKYLDYILSIKNI